MKTSRVVVLLILVGLMLFAPSGLGVSVQKGLTLRDLPAAAQAAISNVLGDDQPEFHWALSDHGWHVANEAQGLHAEVSELGLRVQSGDHSWGMALQGLGYGSNLQAVAAGAVHSATANRIEVARGGLTEWYANGPAGLEQGFTLTSPPGDFLPSLFRVEDPQSETKRRGIGGEVVTLTFALTGSLEGELDTDRAGLTLRETNGSEVLRYGGLVATDANGQELNAWMELNGQSLALNVDDTGAQYPLTIDPLFEAARLNATDGVEGDQLGQTVAISGNVVVVGAPGHDVGTNADQGQAYVFVMPSTGWNGLRTQSAKLRASNGQADDLFGSAVAVSGNVIVVGSLYHAVGGNIEQGQAYVFVMPSTGWQGKLTENARLVASDGMALDLFGRSVAINGNTIVVGASGHVVGGNSPQGEAYIFTMPGTGWAGTVKEKARLVASDGVFSDGFGYSAAISGNTVVVGAPYHGIGGNMYQGEAYVFTMPGTGWAGTLNENARLLMSDPTGTDTFGTAVSASGKTVVVSAPYHSVGGNTFQGQVYVFMMPVSGWTGTLQENATLRAANGRAYDYFGYSVGVIGSTVVAGADNHAVGPNAHHGEAYVFLKPDAGWTGVLFPDTVLLASDGGAGDYFGRSVAASGSTIVVGAWGHAVGGYYGVGEAYVFPRPSTGWAPIRR